MNTVTSFIDEITKVAFITSRDIDKNVQLTRSFDDFKKSLKKGDIVLTKPKEEYESLKYKLLKKLTGSKWAHSAIYDGDGKLIHSFRGLRKFTFGDLPIEVRKHKLDTINKIGRFDFLAIRPKASDKQKNEAVERASKLKRTPYSMWDYLRAGIAPRKVAGKKVLPERVTKLICTGLAEWAYPDLDFKKGIHWTQTTPGHIAKSDSGDQIAAYSEENEKMMRPK